MATVRARYRFTVDHFHRMAAAGVFTEDDRVELLEGEITVMSPIGDRHVACVDFLNDRFGEALRVRALVRVQSPVRLGPHSAPQPDIALLRRSADYYRAVPATPRDVFLVIEVADADVDYPDMAGPETDPLPRLPGRRSRGPSAVQSPIDTMLGGSGFAGPA
ncbi:MAG: Uma2 family endonuclease [Candidatus Rokubacteria bacterium]|nr:Uma2 family endonuclease [Candidatus Rokubacteria bacterium]